MDLDERITAGNHKQGEDELELTLRQSILKIIGQKSRQFKSIY